MLYSEQVVIFFTNLSQRKVFFMSNTKVIEKLSSPHKITLYKNGDNPNIYYYFTFNHKMYRGSTGKSDLKSSIDEVFDIFYEVKTGKRKKLSRGSNKFEEVCKKFLKYKEQNTKKILSPRTLIEYKKNTKFLLKMFKGQDIETLCSTKVFDEYQKWRKSYYQKNESERQTQYKRNGKTYNGRILNNIGNVPINRELRLLVSILRYSKLELELLQNIKVPEYKMLEENKGKKILNYEEFEKLRDYMSINRPFQWMVVSFINSTGIRYPSELLRITWEDVDWDTPCVWIRHRKNPKGGKSVDTPFPLIGTGLDVIKTLWSRDNISKQPEDQVFVNDKGKPVKNIRKCFKTSLEKCGLDTSITMYSFRSRFVTRMVQRNDIPPIVLSSLMGHKSLDMIMNVYESLDKYHYKNILTDSREEYYRNKKEKEERKKKQKTKTDNVSDVPNF